MLFLRKRFDPTFVHLPFQFIGIAFLFYWAWYTPPPGYAVLAIGVIAILMTVCDLKIGNKVVWLALVFAFAWTENCAIAKDRIEANGREKALFDTAQDTAKKTEATLNGVGQLRVQIQDVNSAQQKAIKDGNFVLADQLERQKKDAQTQLDAKLRQNRYSSYTPQNLWDESESVAKDLYNKAEGWNEYKRQVNGFTREAIFTTPKFDSSGKRRDLTDAEKMDIQRRGDARLPPIDAANRKTLAPSISDMTDLRNEILSRLPVSAPQNDALFAKLKTDNFTPEDVEPAVADFKSLMHEFAISRNLKISN
jgi:hypothetical protein